MITYHHCSLFNNNHHHYINIIIFLFTEMEVEIGKPSKCDIIKQYQSLNKTKKAAIFGIISIVIIAAVVTVTLLVCSTTHDDQTPPQGWYSFLLWNGVQNHF